MISCVTCKHLTDKASTPNCALNSEACLTKEWSTARRILSTKYDYKFWEGRDQSASTAFPEGEPEKTLHCFDANQPGLVDSAAKHINSFFKLDAEYDPETNSHLMPEPKVEPMVEVIDHPQHYAEADIPSGIECWDWYELAMTEKEFIGHMKGNVLKYVFRAGRKKSVVEDLEKARAYLKRWITYLNGDRTVHTKGKKNDDTV